MNYADAQSSFQMQSNLFKLLKYLYCLTGMAAIVGENSRDGLQDFASVSPGHHQAKKAGA